MVSGAVSRFAYICFLSDALFGQPARLNRGAHANVMLQPYLPKHRLAGDNKLLPTGPSVIDPSLGVDHPQAAKLEGARDKAVDGERGAWEFSDSRTIGSFEQLELREH